MPRFDEVARLKELEQKALPAWKIVEQEIETQIVSGDEEIFDDGSSHSEYYSNFGADDPNINLAVDLRNAAPWLLEVLACFQPGDDEILELFETYLAAHRPGGHLIEDGPTTADGIDCIRRLRRAMEIMEGQE